MITRVHIKISSWVGLSIGASHCYGQLIFYDRDREYTTLEIRRDLTQKEADRMNQEDRHYSYSEGDSSTRFYERDNIIEVGTTLARRLLGEDIVVRVGSFASAQPERTVYAPEGLWEELKPLEREWFKVWYAHDDPWYTHEHILEPIAEAWRKVNEKHGVK